VVGNLLGCAGTSEMVVQAEDPRFEHCLGVSPVGEGEVHVTHHNPRRVHAVTANQHVENPRREPELVERVNEYRRPRLTMSESRGFEHAPLRRFDWVGQTNLADDAAANTRRLDALNDVSNDLRAQALYGGLRRSPRVSLSDVIAGASYDVKSHLFADRLQSDDIPPEAQACQVNEGATAGELEPPKLVGDVAPIGLQGVFAASVRNLTKPPRFGIRNGLMCPEVGIWRGRRDEPGGDRLQEMLVHERDPQVRGVDRTTDGDHFPRIGRGMGVVHGRSSVATACIDAEPGARAVSPRGRTRFGFSTRIRVISL